MFNVVLHQYKHIHKEHTLLHLVVDPKSSTVNGDSISHFPSLGVIQILLECGIDANSIDKDGNTALFLHDSDWIQITIQSNLYECYRIIVFNFYLFHEIFFCI
jgi:hypothetical protein